MAGHIPEEPLKIGLDPQYFVDDYLVDNRWGNKQSRDMVLPVYHQAQKFEGNPVIDNEGGYLSVVRDAETGHFKMWYQVWYADLTEEGEFEGSNYAIAYAESDDGLKWTRPKLGLHEWNGDRNNNVVWKGVTGARASGPQILRVPEKDRRGYRYILTYRTSGAGKGVGGIRVVGSQDGIHWESENDTLLHTVPSDTLNGIVYDERREEYVMYCRAKDRYRRFKGSLMDTGASRRISRMSHPKLWEAWDGEPQTILNPDELDAENDFHAFYGMPAQYHAGIYWGFLWVFRFNDYLYTELATSRDGYDFDRAVVRQKLIELGEPGSWDEYMIFASPDWVEMGDEWWIYYAGWNGPHGTRERDPGMGLAKIRKGGFVSLRGPASGGGVVTRRMIWPGGGLKVNCDASEGEFAVRVSTANRDVLEGFDYKDCEPFSGDNTEHEVTWTSGRTLNELAGQEIRLEFSLTSADLYSFQATGP